MAALSIRRKADRLAMAQHVQALAQEFGFTVEFQEHDREIVLDVTTACNLHAMVFLDARTLQPNVHCIHWNVRAGDAKLDPATWTRERLNTYHWQKATHIVQNFDGLLAAFRESFGWIRSGRAFQQPITQES